MSKDSKDTKLNIDVENKKTHLTDEELKKVPGGGTVSNVLKTIGGGLSTMASKG
jgi:hypothetical protein